VCVCVLGDSGNLRKGFKWIRDSGRGIGSQVQ
jgi:hypothetical protein